MNEETELKHIAEGDGRLVPASTSAQADKVLTVQADGTPAWKDPTGGGGGEPAQYLKDASVVGDTLTITKKDGTTIPFDKGDKVGTEHLTDTDAHNGLFGEKADAAVVGKQTGDIAVSETSGITSVRIIVTGPLDSPTSMQAVITRPSSTVTISLVVSSSGHTITGTHSLLTASYNTQTRIANITFTSSGNEYGGFLSNNVYDTDKAKDSDKLNGKTEAQLLTNIPKSALASDVQTSLGKADTALQPNALTGSTFSFSTMAGVYDALNAVANAMGAKVTGWPLITDARSEGQAAGTVKFGVQCPWYITGTGFASGDEVHIELYNPDNPTELWDYGNVTNKITQLTATRIDLSAAFGSGLRPDGDWYDVYPHTNVILVRGTTRIVFPMTFIAP